MIRQQTLGFLYYGTPSFEVRADNFRDISKFYGIIYRAYNYYHTIRHQKSKDNTTFIQNLQGPFHQLLAQTEVKFFIHLTAEHKATTKFSETFWSAANWTLKDRVQIKLKYLFFFIKLN